MKDIGSAEGMQSYEGQGTKRLCPGSAFVTSRYFASLRDGCALRGACRARPINIYGGPLLLSGMMMRSEWDLVWSATIPSR